MASITRNHLYTVDLNKPLLRQDCGILLAEGDNNGDCFSFALVRDGVAVIPGGALSVTAYFIRDDGNTVFLTGESSNINRANVTLPQSCYIGEGRFSLAVKVALDGVTTTIAVLDGYIKNTKSDTMIDPGSVIPSLDDLFAQIEAMEQGTAAARNVVAEYDSKVAEQDASIATLTKDIYQFGMIGGYPAVKINRRTITIDASGGGVRVLARNTWSTPAAKTYELSKPETANYAVISYANGEFSSIRPAEFIAQQKTGAVCVGVAFWYADGNIMTCSINGDSTDLRTPAFGGLTVKTLKQYGAAGDGVTDDTAALQAALDDCTNGILFAPPGTYLYKQTLNIHSGTHLIGSRGKSAFKLAHDHNLTEIPWRDTDIKKPAVRFDEGSEGIVIEGMTFSGDTGGYVDEPQLGLLVQGSNHTIRECVISDWNYYPGEWSNDRTYNAPAWGLCVANANHVSICDCELENCGYENAGTENASNVYFDKCFFGNANRTALQIHRGSYRIFVSNCTLYNNTQTELNDFATMTLHGADGKMVDGVKITNCDFRKRHIQCVDGYERNVQISNCRFYSETDMFIILTLGGAPGQPKNTGWMVCGNEFHSTRQDGIGKIIMNVDSSMVANNILYTNASNPVALNGENNLVDNNLIVPIV